MDDDLIAAHRDVPTLMPFLHLPMQSGSDRILAAMNRKHTADDYRRIVDKLRAARPDLALSSDFIVGHPGETEADFEATMALVRDVTFAQAYSFKYSPRPGTPAAGAAGPGAGNRQRPPPAGPAGAVAGPASEIQRRPASGSSCRFCSRDPAATLAKSPGGHHFFNPVHLSGNVNLIGTESMVRIVANYPNSLAGTLVQERRIA